MYEKNMTKANIAKNGAEGVAGEELIVLKNLEIDALKREVCEALGISA